jgi:hypothetical protein
MGKRARSRRSEPPVPPCREPTTPEPERAAAAPGPLMVVQVRLDALKRAIHSRDWAAVEWEFDRVHSSVEKAAAGGAPRKPSGIRN